MDFQAPDPTDLADVKALNRAFLELTTASSLLALPSLPSEQREALSHLGSGGRNWLAESPFLIFSVAEHEPDKWRQLFQDPGGADLIRAMQQPNDAEARFVTTALGFLWQLAKRRPYAVRVLCGATLDWCEQLADSTLIDVCSHASQQAGLLGFRQRNREAFWRRLLAAAASEQPVLRQAARQSALQSILTVRQDERHRKLPAAACAMPMPALKVSDNVRVSNTEGRGYNTPPDESTVDKKPHQDLRKR
jgi:hypothetical protein